MKKIILGGMLMMSSLAMADTIVFNGSTATSMEKKATRKVVKIL